MKHIDPRRVRPPRVPDRRVLEVVDERDRSRGVVDVTFFDPDTIAALTRKLERKYRACFCRETWG